MLEGAIEAVRHLLKRHPGVELCHDDGVWLMRSKYAAGSFVATLRYEHPEHGTIYCATHYDPFSQPISELVADIDLAADALRTCP